MSVVVVVVVVVVGVVSGGAERTAHNHKHTCVCACVFVYMYTSVYVCMYIYIYTVTHVHMYIYIYTSILYMFDVICMYIETSHEPLFQGSPQQAPTVRLQPSFRSLRQDSGLARRSGLPRPDIWDQSLSVGPSEGPFFDSGVCSVVGRWHVLGVPPMYVWMGGWTRYI